MYKLNVNVFFVLLNFTYSQQVSTLFKCLAWRFMELKPIYVFATISQKLKRNFLTASSTLAVLVLWIVIVGIFKIWLEISKIWFLKYFSRTLSLLSLIVFNEFIKKEAQISLILITLPACTHTLQRCSREHNVLKSFP